MAQLAPLPIYLRVGNQTEAKVGEITFDTEASDGELIVTATPKWAGLAEEFVRQVEASVEE